MLLWCRDPSTLARILRGPPVGMTVWVNPQMPRTFGPFGSAQGRRDDNEWGVLALAGPSQNALILLKFKSGTYFTVTADCFAA